MTNICKLLTKVVFLLPLAGVIPHAASAQFIDLTLEIDSRLSAQTEQMLSFGTLNTNSGSKVIELGDMGMGIFKITALETQLLLISLNKPKALYHQNPAVKANVPVQLSASYGYSAENYQNAVNFQSSSQIVTVKTDPEYGLWNTIYIFMYGVITIPDIPTGIYSNDIVLSVQYL